MFQHLLGIIKDADERCFGGRPRGFPLAGLELRSRDGTFPPVDVFQPASPPIRDNSVALKGTGRRLTQPLLEASQPLHAFRVPHSEPRAKPSVPRPSPRPRLASSWPRQSTVTTKTLAWPTGNGAVVGDQDRHFEGAQFGRTTISSPTPAAPNAPRTQGSKLRPTARSSGSMLK